MKYDNKVSKSCSAASVRLCLRAKDIISRRGKDLSYDKWDARNDCCSMDAESDCGAVDTGSECSSVGECGLAGAGTECGISPSSPASSNCRGVCVGESDRESDILNTSLNHTYS